MFKRGENRAFVPLKGLTKVVFQLIPLKKNDFLEETMKRLQGFLRRKSVLCSWEQESHLSESPRPVRFSFPGRSAHFRPRGKTSFNWETSNRVRNNHRTKSLTSRSPPKNQSTAEITSQEKKGNTIASRNPTQLLFLPQTRLDPRWTLVTKTQVHTFWGTTKWAWICLNPKTQASPNPQKGLKWAYIKCSIKSSRRFNTTSPPKNPLSNPDHESIQLELLGFWRRRPENAEVLFPSPPHDFDSWDLAAVGDEAKVPSKNLGLVFSYLFRISKAKKLKYWWFSWFFLVIFLYLAVLC